jgi:hypothetical protein
MSKKHASAPKKPVAPPTIEKETMTQTASPAPVDTALAEAAFNQLRPALEALPAEELKPIRVDLQEAVLVALSLAQRENKAERRAFYQDIPARLFDPTILDRLQPAAWALWYTSRQLALASTSISEAQLPAALVAEAKAVERRMQKCLEYHLEDDPKIGPVLALLKPGNSHSDLASDLQGYGEIYRSHGAVIAHDRKYYRATDLADADRISTQMLRLLAASLTAESRQWTDLRLRAFNLVLGTYDEIADTGWWLHRHEGTRDQDYQGFFAAIRAAFPASSPRPSTPADPTPPATPPNA